MPPVPHILIAVDVGNSRIKLGRFDREPISQSVPVPAATMELSLAHPTGEFDTTRLAAWCRDHLAGDATWWVSSVHRRATERLIAAVTTLASELGREMPIRSITHQQIPLAIEVDAPDRVGMDRLLAAVAANRLRQPDRAAVVVDLGTAIKVDLVTSAGAFAGGAILPGLAISARALEEQTDALPRVDVDTWQRPPEPLGKATVPAIESGLFWGAVGGIRELVGRYSEKLSPPPDIFVSGGGSRLIYDVMAETIGRSVRHEPHLVLLGIALVDAAGN
jgi:type III pantothenate kinase